MSAAQQSEHLWGGIPTWGSQSQMATQETAREGPTGGTHGERTHPRLAAQTHQEATFEDMYFQPAAKSRPVKFLHFKLIYSLLLET